MPSTNPHKLGRGEHPRALYRTLHPDWLRRKYCDELLSRSEIAEIAGVSQYVVNYALKKYAITLPAYMRPTDRHYVDPDWLRRQYLDEQLNIQEISDQSGYSRMVIASRLHRLDIPIRPSWESRRRDRDRSRPWHDPAWLIAKYHDQELSQAQMAAECGCHPQTIAGALHKHGIHSPRHHQAQNETPTATTTPDPVADATLYIYHWRGQPIFMRIGNGHGRPSCPRLFDYVVEIPVVPAGSPAPERKPRHVHILVDWLDDIMMEDS